MNTSLYVMICLWLSCVFIYFVGVIYFTWGYRKDNESFLIPDTSKICPTCGSDKLLLFSSLNKKACPDCHKEIPWTLATGQKGSYE